MQLKVTTDYAVMTVLYVATQKDVVSSAEISKAMRIPQNYITEMTRRLRKAGILETELGVNGGYRLGREPWDINLYEIIEAMEGTTKINSCLDEDHYCARHMADKCTVRKNYEKLQQLLEDALSGMTIESLME